MDLNIITPKRGENEISDDDDYRNHKHLRREAQYHSRERDALEHVLTRPFKKRKTPSYPYNSQSSEVYRSYNISLAERNNFTNFDKRRHDIAPPFSRAPLDLNQRIRATQLHSWAPNHDSKFILTDDFSSQMVRPSHFSGRGMQNVSNTPWSTFGLNNQISDTLSLVRPPINHPVSISITKQRCRDFEEKGFCLRGDRCPMEHGINRIVVEDLQSLSQFNLSAALPPTNLAGPPAGPTAPSTTVMNSTYKNLHSKFSCSRAIDNFMGSAVTTESDLYDPDQPLWANESSKTSNAVPLLIFSKNDVTEPLLGAQPTDDRVGIFEGADLERPIRSSRNISETREKPDPVLNVDETGSPFAETPLRTQSQTWGMVRRPSQRAHRTLFLRNIPLEMKKKETLLVHFKKFGQVNDIYIPANSDRAFVQFCNREDADAAVRSPDAVMGNRFIKLRWANRDNKPEDGTSSGSVVQSQPLVSDKGKNKVQSASSRGSAVSSSEQTIKGSKVAVAAASQKKVEESLESLKEEIRKKQEMLDQKRNDFRLKLEKLQKQSTLVKGDVAAPKKDAPREAEETSSTTTSPTAVTASLPNTKTAKNLVANRSNTYENISFKHPIRSPLANPASPFIANRFKLDNRPTTFKIIPPLPAALADVSVLKEHFSTFGDLSSVDLEDLDSNDARDESKPSKIVARISFSGRRSAELAFLKGKRWKVHNLHFAWVESSSKEKTSSSSKGSSDTNNTIIQPASGLPYEVTQKDSNSGEGESENWEKLSDEDLLINSPTISSQKHSP